MMRYFRELVAFVVFVPVCVACDGNHSKSGRGSFFSGRETLSSSEDLSHDVVDDQRDSSSTDLAQGSETLIWKRYRPFEHALMSGLALSKTEVCMELGKRSCIDEIHLTVMGGNEPYQNAQYERAQSPTILTSVAVERVVLAACEQRLSKDKSLGSQAAVFNQFPISDQKVSKKKIRAQARNLYNRLLARDPNDDEIDVIFELLDMNMSAEKIALSMCFVIGTQAENLFL